MSPRMRKNRANAKAGLWEIRIKRFNPFNPDLAVLQSAEVVKIPVHHSISSTQRGVLLKDLDEEALEYWATIPENSFMLLHINYPAQIISSYRACMDCINDQEKEDLCEFLKLEGFESASISEA